MKFFFKYLVSAEILMLLFFSCADQKLESGSGVLKGKISIGPLCPVETDPPAPGCLPTIETYKAWATAVWTINKKTKLMVLDPKLDGTYQTTLPAGVYTIDFSEAQSIRIGGSNLPALISITEGDTTTFDIHIDTGIR